MDGDGGKPKKFDGDSKLWTVELEERLRKLRWSH
jgi:hypothetical protein